MNSKLQLSIISTLIVLFFLPQISSGDVSVPWVTKDHHAHAEASYSNTNIIPEISDNDVDDSYSPPLLLPISASASVSTSPPPQSASSSGTITTSDMEVIISASDNSEDYAGGSAENNIIGSFFATTPVFQFSYSYDYDISVYCGNYPFDYNAYNAISATLKVTDKTDSVVLFDGQLVNASLSCNSLVNPGESSEVDSGSSLITVSVIVGHEIEVEFGNSGYVDGSGCTAGGDTEFTFQYNTSEQVQAKTLVPWNSEDYHASGGASYWSDTNGSSSDSCDAYSPPLQIPVNCTAAVSLSSCLFGPLWKGELCQEAIGTGTINTAEMVVSTSAFDILWDGTNITDVNSNALDEFIGVFNASHDLFQFSYSYVYDLHADCCGVPDITRSDNNINGWLRVTDLTDSVILLDDTFLNIGASCYADVTDSGMDQLSVLLTVGHDIEVEFGIDGYSSVSGSYSLGSSDLNLQYETAMRCVDPPVINSRIAEYYASFQAGYDNPALLNGDAIKSQALEIEGDLAVNRGLAVIFESGYNCDYSSIIGRTTLNGNVTISDGLVIIESGTLEVI